MGRAWSHPEAVEGKVELGSRKCFFGIQGAPSSAGMCPPRTPAILRFAGTTLKSAKTGATEGSEFLSSAGSGTTDDHLFVLQFNACALRDQRIHQTDEDRCFHGR